MDFLDIVKSIGFPSAVLVFVGIAIWRIMVWAGNKVVEPVVAAHIQLVESAKTTNETNAKTLEKMTAILEANDNRDKATYTLVVDTHNMVKELKDKG